MINKILDFLPLKVIYDAKYSCWEPQFIDKIKRNKDLVFTKDCLPELYPSSNLQKFIHAKLKTFAKFWPYKTFYSIIVQVSKLVNLNSIVFIDFLCASCMSKLFQVNITYFTLKNVLIWFFISRTCEFKILFWFSFSFIHLNKFLTKIQILTSIANINI